MFSRYLLEMLDTRIFTNASSETEMVEKRPNLAVGDYVLLMDENCPHGRWPKGVIQEVFPDQHGVVRHVTVKTATTSLRHDIRKLCLLEWALMS